VSAGKTGSLSFSYNNAHTYVTLKRRDTITAWSGNNKGKDLVYIYILMLKHYNTVDFNDNHYYLKQLLLLAMVEIPWHFMMWYFAKINVLLRLLVVNHHKVKCCWRFADGQFSVNFMRWLLKCYI